MAEDLISSIIDNPAIDAEIAKVEKRLAELATTLKTFPKATVFSDASNIKQQSEAIKAQSTVLEQLKVKNLELTNSIKEQQLVERQAAAERKQAAAAQKEADRQVAAAAKQKIADDKAAAAAAQVAAQEKLRALKLQQEKEEELLSIQKKRAEVKPGDLGTFDIEQGSGQSGQTGLKKTVVKEAAFVPANATEENLLFLTKTETALKANQAVQKDLGDQLKRNEISQERYNAKIVEARAAELEYKKQIQLTNAELKARTNLDFSVQGSIDAARAENALLIPQRNAIAAKEEFATPEDLVKLKELNAEIDKNNELIDKNSDLLGKQKINIGNYPTNAFSQTFKTLNSELESVQGKLVSGNFKGTELDKLTAKFDVLTNATKTTGKEFSSTGAQSKAFMEAGVQIGQVYGKDSDFFKQFSSQVRSGAVNIKNMANEVAGVATKGKGFMGFLSTAYSGLRKLANIIPGAGIATLVLLLLGPLQAAGAALVKWSKTATAAGRANEELKTHTKELNDALKEGASSYVKATIEIENLKQAFQQAKDGVISKKEALKLYNSTIGKTTGEVKDLDAAELALAKNADAYIQFTLLKAAANIALEKSANAAFTAQFEKKKDATTSFLDITDPITLKRERIKQAEQEKKDFESVAKDLFKQAEDIAKKFKFNFNPVDIKPEKDGAAKKSHEDSERLADEFRKKDLEALAKFTKDELTILKNRYKEEADNQNRSMEERLKSVEDYYKVSAQLIANDVKAQEDALKLEVEVANKRASKIGDPKKRADAQNAIEKYRVDKLKSIQQDGATQTTALDRETYKEKEDIATQYYDNLKKEVEDYYKFLSEQSKIVNQNNKDDIDISAGERVLELQNELRNGSIKSIEEYNRKKQEIESKADIEKEKLDLKQLQDQKDFFDSLNAIRGDFGFRDVQLEKDIQDALIKIGEDGYDKEKAIADKRIELKRQLRDQLENTLQDIVSGSFDKAQQKNEADLKAIDEKSQREISAINASGLAEEEKQRRVMAIQKQADFQKQQIERRQQQNEVARAKFERAASIARIVQSTAEAIAATLGMKPWTPANIALAAVTGAIGAAQIASVLAQPLPHYEKGTKDAKKGLAVVGEKGSELILDKQGKTYLTPAKPSLIELAGGEQIFKHDITKDMLNHYNLLSILQKAQNAKQPIKVENGFNKRAIDLLSRIERKAPFVIQIQNGMETSDYYMRNIKN